MSEEIPLRVGQIWSERRNKPTIAFLITKIYEKRVPERNYVATRVKGIYVHSPDDHDSDAQIGGNNFDSRSFRKMYPALKFAPVIPPEETPK